MIREFIDDLSKASEEEYFANSFPNVQSFNYQEKKGKYKPKKHKISSKSFLNANLSDDFAFEESPTADSPSKFGNFSNCSEKSDIDEANNSHEISNENEEIKFENENELSEIPYILLGDFNFSHSSVSYSILCTGDSLKKKLRVEKTEAKQEIHKKNSSENGNSDDDSDDEDGNESDDDCDIVLENVFPEMKGIRKGDLESEANFELQIHTIIKQQILKLEEARCKKSNEQPKSCLTVGKKQFRQMAQRLKKEYLKHLAESNNQKQEPQELEQTNEISVDKRPKFQKKLIIPSKKHASLIPSPSDYCLEIPPTYTGIIDPSGNALVPDSCPRNMKNTTVDYILFSSPSQQKEHYYNCQNNMLSKSVTTDEDGTNSDNSDNSDNDTSIDGATSENSGNGGGKRFNNQNNLSSNQKQIGFHWLKVEKAMVDVSIVNLESKEKKIDEENEISFQPSAHRPVLAEFSMIQSL